MRISAAALWADLASLAGEATPAEIQQLLVGIGQDDADALFLDSEWGDEIEEVEAYGEGWI